MIFSELEHKLGLYSNILDVDIRLIAKKNGFDPLYVAKLYLCSYDKFAYKQDSLKDMIFYPLKVVDRYLRMENYFMRRK